MKETTEESFYSSTHEPYFEYESGLIIPVLGFEASASKYEPLVPDGDGNVVPASSLGSGRILTDKELESEDERELLHG